MMTNKKMYRLETAERRTAQRLYLLKLEDTVEQQIQLALEDDITATSCFVEIEPCYLSAAITMLCVKFNYGVRVYKSPDNSDASRNLEVFW